ncbi:MAG: thioredoxin family protein [Candidatus Zixiibacteriota bacterium]|nr:MAG: thioredoxin family protein [candidate division Zixibacteria bacterium]
MYSRSDRFTSLAKLAALSVGLMALVALNLMGAEDRLPGTDSPPKDSTAVIEWQAYDAGLSEAKEENKHVFIGFTARWCYYCRKMDREVFTDPQVIELVNKDFVPVRVDGDSKRELDIDGYKITEKNLTVGEFGVRNFPTFWFLKPDGTKLGALVGYRPAEEMLKALVFVKDYRYDSTDTSTEDTE